MNFIKRFRVRIKIKILKYVQEFKLVEKKRKNESQWLDGILVIYVLSPN